jgi:hypothetical protein
MSFIIAFFITNYSDEPIKEDKMGEQTTRTGKPEGNTPL